MSKRLIYYGNETLRKVSDDINNIDGSIIKLADTMSNVMRRESGIGLAAPQIDILKRLIVIDLEAMEGPSLTMINPIIEEKSTKMNSYDEGCLSLPGISGEILRPESILVKGIDLEGKEMEFEANDLFARVIQHEIDHLNGVLFIDHLDDYIKKELTAELKKIKKLNKAS